jgi:hypothetical protein
MGPGAQDNGGHDRAYAAAGAPPGC